MGGWQEFQVLGIALGLGLLVGLQRERHGDGQNERLAGIRTFPLITVFGALSALLARETSWWVIAAALLAVVGMTVAGMLLGREKGTAEQGITTEIAILVMFGVGAYLVVGNWATAVVVGGGTALLLHAKSALHGFARRLGDDDLRAIMQFALVSLVVLPVVPNRTFGSFPFDVLNPYKIWWMVVLVTGISLAGYLILKFMGQRVGMVLSGVLGGLISSTATTLSFARRTKKEPEIAAQGAFVVMMASSVLWARVLVLMGVTNLLLLDAALWPFAVMLAVSLAVSFALMARAGKDGAQIAPKRNPTDLREGLVFAGIFAVVLVGLAYFGKMFGERGVYAMSAISGLTDMDAATLSMSQMSREQSVEMGTAWRAVLVAALANTVFKAAVAASLGDAKFRRLVVAGFGVVLAAGVGVLVVGVGG